MQSIIKVISSNKTSINHSLSYLFFSRVVTCSIILLAEMGRLLGTVFKILVSETETDEMEI